MPPTKSTGADGPGSLTFAWIDDELQALSAAGLFRSARVCEPLPQGRCRVDGLELVNLASNDYLGLASDPHVVEAGVAALRKYGSGARASSLVSGRTPLHEELEQSLARFEHAESAVLFPTGYAANLGVIGALVEAGDTVFCDRLNHASLIDGCRLSGARLRVYAHAELASLDRELAKAVDSRRRLIVTDSVFSMDADLAPLAELEQLATRYAAMLVVDESHATGLYGPTGRGLCEASHGSGETPPKDRSFAERSATTLPLAIGTLSKALGSQGGFVTGPRSVCDWIRNRARPQMFSTGLTPAACGSALAALRIMDAEPDRRERVRSLARWLRAALRAVGLTPWGDEACPIVPLVIGAPEAAVRLSGELAQQGYLVPAIRPPTVPTGTSRLRITLTAEHDTHCLQRLVQALAASSARVGSIPLQGHPEHRHQNPERKE